MWSKFIKFSLFTIIYYSTTKLVGIAVRWLHPWPRFNFCRLLLFMSVSSYQLAGWLYTNANLIYRLTHLEHHHWVERSRRSPLSLADAWSKYVLHCRGADTPTSLSASLMRMRYSVATCGKGNFPTWDLVTAPNLPRSHCGERRVQQFTCSHRKGENTRNEETLNE